MHKNGGRRSDVDGESPVVYHDRPTDGALLAVCALKGLLGPFARAAAGRGGNMLAWKAASRSPLPPMPPLPDSLPPLPPLPDTLPSDGGPFGRCACGCPMGICDVVAGSVPVNTDEKSAAACIVTPQGPHLTK